MQIDEEPDTTETGNIEKSEGNALADVNDNAPAEVNVRASLKLLKAKKRIPTVKSVEESSIVETYSEPDARTADGNTILDLQNSGQASNNQITSDQPPKISKSVVAKKKLERPIKSVIAMVAPQDCTRSSGCTCSACSIPIEVEPLDTPTAVSRWDEDHPTQDDNPGEMDGVQPKETELQRRRREMNSQKAKGGKKTPAKSEKYVS